MDRVRHYQPWQTLHELLEANFMPACTVICRRSALDAVGGFWQPPGVPTTDYPTWLQLCRTGSFASVDGILGSWRRHDSQVTAQMEPEMLALPALPWATIFSEKLSAAEQASLRLTPSQARRIDDRRRQKLDFIAGRVAMRSGRWKDAELHLRRAVRTGDGRTRLKAMAGFAFVRLGLDIEPLVRLRDRIPGLSRHSADGLG
jgi:hypothetical protein